MRGAVHILLGWALGIAALAAPPHARAQDPMETAGTAFQIAQTVQTSVAAQAVQQIALRLALKEGGLEGLALERRDLMEEVQRTRADTDLSDAQRRTAIERLDTALLVNTRALAAGFPGYRDIVAPDPLTIAEAQSLLGPDEALIQMHQGVGHLSVWLVSQRHVLWHRAAIDEASARELVRLFREGMGLGGTLRAAAALDGGTEDAPAAPFHTGLGANIYALLFGPFDAEIAQHDHLMIVADKAWIGLPFAALLTDYRDGPRSPTPQMLRGASWMGMRHAITMLPSAVSLRAARVAAARDAPGATTLLALGDPLFGGTQGPEGALRAGGGVALADLVPLPGTRREVNAIAAAFDAPEVLLGADATEAAVRAADLSTKDVIVFATHGLIAGELQGLSEPALAMTPPAQPSPEDDGLLTAGQVAGLTLNADWVVLSACNTAAGNGDGAEGLSGLARAFFAAGAQTLLVSHWPVRDDAAARLTSAAFAEMRADPTLRKAEAMRRAMQALMQDQTDPSLSHPTAWAPFFVVGG